MTICDTNSSLFFGKRSVYNLSGAFSILALLANAFLHNQQFANTAVGIQCLRGCGALTLITVVEVYWILSGARMKCGDTAY